MSGTVDSDTGSSGPTTSARAPGTRASEALDRVMELIRSGDLRPGDVVNEVKLARRFGMSRGPMREAVRTLEGRNIVTREAYQRARVASLGHGEVRDIFQLRESLESMACRLATRCMSDEALASLADRVDRARTPREYSFVYTDHAFNFHEEIVRHCGNHRIQDVLSPEIYDMVRLSRWQTGKAPAAPGPTAREHWQIVRAMLARDEELAESLMRSHIQRVARLAIHDSVD